MDNRSSYDDAIAYSRRWLDIIRQETLSPEQAREIITETRENFAEHFNRGFLEYRKSVTEAGDWTAVEWTGRVPPSGMPWAGSISTVWVGTGC